MMKHIFSFFALFLIAAQSCTSQVPREVPTTLPAFTFYTLNENKAIDRKALVPKGNIVLVFFDPGCSHCRNEISALGENFQHVKAATIYLISQQDRPLVREFMNSYGKKLQGKPKVHVLIDSRYEFLPKFYPRQYPAVYVYGEDRKLKTYLDGENPIAKVLAAINK